MLFGYVPYRPHESKDFVTSARTRGGEPGIWVTVLICIHLLESKKNHPARSLQHQEECEYCSSSTTGRETGRELCEESVSVIGGTGRRIVARAATREPERARITGGGRGGDAD